MERDNHILTKLIIMKKLRILLFGLLLSVLSLPASAENDFFFNIYGGSNNLWSSTYLQLPTNLLNDVISNALGNGDVGGIFYGATLRYDLFSVNNGGAKVKLDKGSYWGFKSKDMFSHVCYGLKFGWQPELSPFGIYVACAYQFNKFKAQFDPNINSWEKYKMNSIRPGIGIRITPFINMLKDKGGSPIIEVGTSYNYYFSCKAPYDNDKNQFKSGMISTLGIGTRFYRHVSVTGGVELDHYSIFNQEFTPDNGISYPYKDIKSKKMTIFISVSHDF